MAGQVRTVLLSALMLAATVASGLAQATPGPATTPKEFRRPGFFNGHPPGGPDAAAYENVRKAIEALTPEQRKRFQENFMRWANLSPEEKKALRDREEVRKKFIEQEVEAAIQESGLQLDGERREQFARRYGEERRKIEEQMRAEMAEKRKPLVREMIARLKTEFANGAAPATPAAAPQQTIQTSTPPVKP